MAKKRIEQLYEEFKGFINTLSEDDRGWEVPKHKKDQYYALKNQGKSTGEAIAIIRSQMDEEKISELDTHKMSKPRRKKKATYFSPGEHATKISTIRNLNIYLIRDDDTDTGAEIKAGVDRGGKEHEEALVIYGNYNQGTNSFDIAQTEADAKYIGSGIGFIVYKELVMKGITLISGDAHTKGSQIIWRKLIEDPSVFVYAFDIGERIKDPIEADIKDPIEVDIHDGKVMAGDTNVYEDFDLALIAKKK